MRKARFAAALATTTLLLAVPNVGQASVETGVNSVNATAGSSVVNVSGNASFTDTPFIVMEDGVGDVPVPGIGTDINVATIARPVGLNNLIFKWTIADQLPSPLVADPAAAFLWPFSINGAEKLPWPVFLMAGRAGGFPSPSANAGFSLMQNNTDAGGFEPVGGALSGTFANGEVSWTMPMSRAGLVTGDTIGTGSGSPSGTMLGVHQVVYGILTLDDFFAEDYVVPGATVKLGIATAGTPENEVALTVNAGSVNATTGAFSGSLPKPPAGSGLHIVVAQACYAADVCGTASTTVNV